MRREGEGLKRIAGCRRSFGDTYHPNPSTTSTTPPHRRQPFGLLSRSLPPASRRLPQPPANAWEGRGITRPSSQGSVPAPHQSLALRNPPSPTAMPQPSPTPLPTSKANTLLNQQLLPGSVSLSPRCTGKPTEQLPPVKRQRKIYFTTTFTKKKFINPHSRPKL